MGKYLVLSFPQILTQRLAFHEVIVFSVRAPIHRSTLPLCRDLEKIIFKVGLSQMYFYDLASLIHHLLG